MLKNRVCTHPNLVDQFLVIQFPSNIVTFYCSECSATVSVIRWRTSYFNPIQLVIYHRYGMFFGPLSSMIEFNDLPIIVIF